MNAEERAEKICNLIIHGWVPGAPNDERIAQIAAEIREAVDDAEKALDARCKAYYDECINEAVEEAYEDAAKIAEAGPKPGSVVEVDGDVRDCGAVVTGWQRKIADMIRARAKEAS